jgi:hypothetical protein
MPEILNQIRFRSATNDDRERIEKLVFGVLEEAIRLYTRFGFRPLAQSHLSARCDQAYYYDLW